MHKVKVSLQFEKGYIADPYWPELEKLINIQKESGMNRARTAPNREKALAAYLEVSNIKREEYERLAVRSQRKFYRGEDVIDENALDGRDPHAIVIPAHQLYGCLAQACGYVASSQRIARVEELRTVVQVSAMWTAKTEGDGVWDRFVVVKSGTGKALSNQRSLRSNEFIQQFTAEGEVTFIETDNLDQQSKKVKRFFELAGEHIGVGASRKMGWGRFAVEEWA